MSGHSKWHSIRHKKAKEDAKRGKIFSKLIKEITVAARIGGGDPDGNPRLRTILAEAKSVNMPADNIERAIKKGTGELPGVSYEEAIYEGYGPGGTALMVEVLTDNKNRTVSELRHILSKNGGNLGENGCVAWMFEKKGYITVDAQGVDEEALLEVVLEAGAEDMTTEGDVFEIYTAPEDFVDVKESIEKAGFLISSSEITMIPNNTVRVEGKKAEQVIKLMEALEDHEDVNRVYSNFDIPEEQLEEATN